ncbi:MAG: DUF885 family protein, partial [Acidimicrobiales bacterium]|nr:DUF885 family protein [Acidimicrobiales bacterium]
MTAADDLRDLAERYWEARLAASPLFATFLGDHRYDDRADDLSAEAEAAQRDAWSAFASEAASIPVVELDETDRVTHHLLAEELRQAVDDLDLRLAELASDQMTGAHADLLMMAGQLHAPEPAHAAMAVTRIEALARML